MEAITFIFQEIINWFFLNPFAQIIGIFAFAASMYTFLAKSDISFLWRMTFSSLVWALHFLLLGALSAGLLNAVDIIKNLLAIRFPMNKRIAAGMVIVYVIIGITVFSQSGIFTDWLPVIGSIASTIILFTLKGVWMRVAFLCVIMGWIVYNFSVHSLGGLTTDIVLFITGIIGILHSKNESKPEQGNSEKSL